MAPNDTIQPYIDRARREFGHATPLRVGWLVGRDGADVPCPYAVGSRGAKSFHLGKEKGRKDAAKKEQNSNTTAA